MLGEAVDGVLGVPGLDSLLRPMTAYDRLRFGGPTVRELWVDLPRAEFLTPPSPAWTLRTERLVLRPFRPEDAESFADAWASEEWTSLLLTRTLNRAEVGEMVRRRMDPGDGRFVGLVVEHDGEVVGDSLLILQGTGLNEGEIGWTVLPQHAGKGYATEAAREVLRLAFEDYGLRRVIANLDARNGRSAALCERLGMRREAHRLRDFWSKGTWTDSYEYALLAEEWRAGRTP
jgi:RimJ/RimL family protein N-acetyltransferase